MLARDTIYDRIWGFDFETGSRSLDVYIGYLRRKTEAGGEPRLVHTVRGVGYVAARADVSLRWRIALGLGADRRAGDRVVGATARTSTSPTGCETSIDESLLATRAELVTADEDDRDHERPSQHAAAERRDPASRDDDDDPFSRPAQCPPRARCSRPPAAQVVGADGTVTVVHRRRGRSCRSTPTTARSPVPARRLAASATVTVDGRRLPRRSPSPLSDGGALQIARGLDEIDDVLDVPAARGSSRIGLAGVGAAGAARLARRPPHRAARRAAARHRRAHRRAPRTSRRRCPVGGAERGRQPRPRASPRWSTRSATSRREQQQLVSDASHELRTPLTSLRTNAELLARADELDPERAAPP